MKRQVLGEGVWHEDDRLAALESYGILDTPREAEFDDIVQMAAQACGCPIGLLSLIDRNRQWFKAEVGLGLREMPLESSVFTCALDAADVMEIPDLAMDPRFADNPMVRGSPHARFYAGVPITSSQGFPIGVLCVLAREPSRLTDEQLFILKALARTVMAKLEHRRAVAERDRALEQQRDSELRARQILDSAIDYGIISFDLAARVTSWNEGARLIMGWTEEDMLGERADRIFVPEDLKAGIPEREMGNALAHGRGMDERWHLRKNGERFWGAGEMMALHDDAGGTKGFIKILRDRTEQHLAGIALERSQQRVASALSTGLVGFFEWDVARGLLVGDEHFARLYGVMPDDMRRGMPLADMVRNMHHLDLPAVMEDIRQATEQCGDYAQSFRLSFKDGTTRWLMVRARCTDRDGDKPLRYSGVSIDVTSGGAAQARLRLLSEAAARLLTTDEPHEALGPVLEAAAAEIGFDQCYSYDVLPDGQHLQLVYAIGVPDERRHQLQQAPFSGPPCGIVAGTGKPLIVSQVQATTDPRLASARDTGLSAFAGFPIFLGDRLVNVISFGSFERPAFDEETLTFFATLVRYLSVVRERREREAALRMSEHRYRSLFGSIDAGFCIVEMRFDAAGQAVDYRIVEANPAFEQQTGTTGLAGTWVSDALPDLDQSWFDIYGGVARTGESIRFENYATPFNRWYEVHAYPTGQPGANQVAVLFSDITARKAAEDELRALNETLEQRVSERTAERDRMWRLSSDLMDVCSVDGRLLAVNDAWTTLLGWSEQELLASNFLDLIHPEDIQPTVDELQTLDRGVSTMRFENRFRCKDGSHRLISWTASPHEDRFYAIGRDITAQRQVEEQLRQSQKMEAVGQLTGGIAHDFNNMLTGVIGSLDMLKRNIVSGRADRVDRYIEAATTSAQRAAGLTQRLLAFSRRQSLDVRPVDITQLVVGMEDLLRRTLGENIGLQVRLPADTWLAMTDANQLESAILNLAINSRDAMPDGGTLLIETVNVMLRAHDAGTVDDLAPGDFAVLSVSDTGTGMTPDVAAKAFDPFFTTKPIGQGTGLGLSMIFGFAKQSGGHARIISEVGRGTTIMLYLPRSDGHAVTLSEPQEETRRAAAGECVLVVEDDPAVRMLILDVLDSLGYSVMQASDGRAALPLLDHAERIDLLITDVGLPGLNGRQVAEIARQKRPGLRVLFITGYAEKAAMRGGFLEEGMEIVTKPFAVDALAARIRAMIEGGP